jgi:hypothetical protein
VKVVTANQIIECADILDAGGIVAIPTRRWYMLCADSTNALASRWSCHPTNRWRRCSRCQSKPVA